MNKTLSAVVMLISFASSMVFLYLTFNDEINQFLGGSFTKISPFISGLLLGVAITILFFHLKK